MKITVNGTEKKFDEHTSIFDVIEQEGVVEMMIAVARNGEHVPKDKWEDTNLKLGDIIDIVSPMQGG